MSDSLDSVLKEIDLTTDMKSEFIKQFKEADKNKDGVLSKDEYADLLAKSMSPTLAKKVIVKCFLIAVACGCSV